MARFVALFVAAFVAAAAAPTALASHNGNNAAELSAPGDPGATGKAIVNYSEGRGDFNGTITVRNLAPPRRDVQLLRAVPVARVANRRHPDLLR